MKANEMPERIYLFDYNDAMVTPLEGDTVYVREDAFIEKVSAWIKKRFSETDWRFNQDYTGMLINDFKETIK